MKTVKELAQAAESYKRGERESFNTIYELSSRYLYTCIMYAVQDKEAAMDLMQDTYLEISTKLHQLENTDSFLQWATVIANRKCYAYLKKKKAVLLEDDKDGVSYIDTITDDEKLIPESILQDREKQRLVRDIINNLSDMQRLCVIGYFYNEEKQEQIAEDLGIPVNTVKSHLNRAKKIIKEKVLELEKKEGTKLYGIAPFLLLFYGKEAEACEKIPMSQRLKESVGKSVQGNTAAGALAKLSSKAKLGIGIGTVAVVAAVGGIAMAGLNRSGDEGTAEIPIEETVQEIPEENDEDGATEIVTDESDNEEVTEPDVDTAAQKNTGQGEFVELDIAGEYDQFSTAWNGRVIVVKGDMCGLVTYEGEELVPLEYTSFISRVNNDGQVVFVKDGTYSVFDQDGNLLLETDQPIRCVSDGIVLIVDQNQDTGEYDFQYQTLDGKVIYRPDSPWYVGQTGAVGFNEGFAFAVDESNDIRLTADGNYTSMVDLRAEHASNEETVQSGNSDSAWEVNAGSGGQGVMDAYPIGICHNGYYVSRGMIFDDSNGKLYVSDAEGTETYKFQMWDLYEYAGYDYYTSDIGWTIYGYPVNGSTCYSYGTIINVSLQDGDQETYYLFDLAKLDWDIWEIGTGMYRPDKMIITDDALLAVGDDISLSDNKYWLYARDGKYGYIDHEGNVMEMFDGASKFVGGMAVVIEDGQAYLIDEEFNRTETGIAADSVAAYGEMFVLWNRDEKTCLVFPD